jgi:hypothetical protein
MPTPTQSIWIPEKAQAGFKALQDSCLQSYTAYSDIREHYRQIDISYQRTRDLTEEQRKARLANRAGDTNKYQNIEVPIIYPQVEEAVTYQAGVFLTGYPLFTVVADPKNMDAAMQMNTIIEENSIRGGWVRQFMMAFRDGFKYNLLAMEVDWTSKAVAVLEDDVTATNSGKSKVKEVIWSGNTVKRLDPYNLFYDRRYNPAEVSERGEYAGYSELCSRSELKKRINSMPSVIMANIVPAYESASPSPFYINSNDARGYYIPQVQQNPDLSVLADTNGDINWMAWVGAADGNRTIAYQNSYVWTVLYARIIPADFGLKVSSAQTPQVWRLTYVNNQVLICAERLTNAHDRIPILFGQPQENGLGIQDKSLAENVAPFQSVTSAMLNSVMAARRRAISDRTLYDPSRVSEAHINSANPSAKIPVRPSAYGKPLSEAVYPFPFRDDQSGILLQEMQQVSQLADLVSGQNRARRGQFQKGNKTLREYEDVMNNSSGRDQMCSLSLEAQIFTPLKELLKINILQYQGVAKIFSQQLQQEVNIDPVALRNTALSFKISDGLQPASKLISADTFQVALQTIGSSPQIGASYNIGPMFSYLMKTQNTDLTPFEKSPAQVEYEAAVQRWQQLAILSTEKGVEFKVPQPVPQQYGYDPQQQVQASKISQSAQPAQVESTQTPQPGAM